MANTPSVIIGDWSFVLDSPLGMTYGFNSPHTATAQIFTDMVAAGMSRVRLNVVMDNLVASSPSASPSTWNWGFVDAAVEAANKVGLRVTLIARGHSPSKTAWSVASPCDPAGVKYYTTAANYAIIAVALARRYNGDGNKDNAFDSTGKKRLQADCMEIGNEEFNTYQDTSSQSLSPLVYKTGCDSPMRYVSYVRTVLPQLRTPSSQGGGGWIPRGNFLARVGQWGIVHSLKTDTQVDFTVMTAPPTDSTWNASGNHNSIWGFDSTLSCQMLDYANFHHYSDNQAGYDHGKQTADIRAILNSAGNTSIPIWCTEMGASGPVTGQSEASQAAYYDDGTGGSGVLAKLKSNGCQHVDIFTMNDTFPNKTSSTYLGEDMSIVARTPKSPTGTYVRFAAYGTIQNFVKIDNGAWAAKAWPAGFGNQPTGGGSGGGGGGGGNPPPSNGVLTGSFAPVGNQTINLTTEAASGDWMHEGLTGTTFDHKATGGSLISNFSVIGNGSAAQNPNAVPGFTWSDGTPDASATNTQTGVKVTPPQGASGTPHIMMVALENHSYNNSNVKYVIGNPNMPHINTLAAAYASCTAFYGVTHESLPNYLAFVSGSDQGGPPDTTTSTFGGNTLADSLDAANINWKHYAENLPSAGYTGNDTGGYIKHHDPWVWFKTFLGHNATYQQTHLVPYADASVGLQADLTNGVAPPFVFVQPNNSDNGHNSGTDTSCDNWVNSFVPMVQASSWYTAHNGIIILWWDESNPDTDIAGIGDKGSNSSYPHGGHTCCIVISAQTSGYGAFSNNLNHYGILKAINNLYGLPALGNDAHTVNGDITPLLGSGGGSGATTSNLGNGFKITAPADANTRQLNVYVDANAGIGTLAASLSDGSASDFYDSSLNNASGVSAGEYSLVYSADPSSPAGQLLSIYFTLQAGLTAGTVKSSDTYTRANQSGLGTSSDGETYTITNEVGTPAWSIASNQAKLTSTNAGDTGVALLGSHTLQDCEIVGIVQLSNLADSGGLVLRATSGAASYYRASLTNNAIVLAYVTGGVSTILNSQPASPVAGSPYWLRFRIVKNSLYARYWPNDGSPEPADCDVFAVDSTLTSAGQYGIRGMIATANDTINFDTLSVIDLSATGDPSYVSLYAADLPTGVVTASGSLSLATSTPTGSIDLTAESTSVGDWIQSGFSGANSLERKAGVTQQLSGVSPVGSGTYSQDASALLTYTWEGDGTPDASASTTTGTAVQGVANGFSFTAPADTTPRTLYVYVQATKAQGQLTATLSDGSASAVSDSSLNDSGTGSVLKYTLTYNAASPNQTLNVQWVMLTDNGGSGTSTTYSSDTFTRANNASSWNPASNGETYVHTQLTGTGTPTESISSNTGQITATANAVMLSLLGTQTQANAEASARWSLTNLSNNTIGIVLRATSTNTFYRAAATNGNTFKITKTIGGTDTDLVTTTFNYTTGTKYWIRFRINGSNLYGRIWADGSSEPTTWTLTTTDSSISGAGQWGFRSKVSSGNQVNYDSYTVTSIPVSGTPGSIEFQAADTPNQAGSSSGGPNPPPPAGSIQIQINATDALTTPFLGVGVQQDPYTVQ